MIRSTTMAEQVPSLLSTGLIVVSVIIPLLSIASISLRFRARRLARLPLYADDWWIIVAWLFAFSLSINAWIFSSLVGINNLNVDPVIGTQQSLLCILVSSLLVQIALTVVKIAILLFYKRIFSTRIFRVIVWVTIGLVSIWGILFFFLVLLESDPVSASWNPMPGFRFRFSPFPLALSQVGTSIALDFVVLFLPVPIIFRLHMATRKKIAIGLIFWLGSFCCVAAIVRAVLLSRSLQNVVQSQNAVYTQSLQFIFMILEPNFSIVAACLPTLGPLFIGARGPESMIRSVRSFLSIGSRNSKNGPETERPYTEVGSARSDIELHGRNDWPGSKHDVKVVTSTEQEHTQYFGKSGINVTTGIEIDRE
ncbi:hypothetical protein F5Y14DRAFT_415006 [Nemania sp. NC0429]|nr:hypothetical protein F5Y14DRAFT_415006 [Nemania sp. NC0429]